MKSLQDKVVVVTGAGSGIGRALAERIAVEGGLLALSDWDSAGLAQTAGLLRERTGRAPHTQQVDVRDREAMQKYAAAVAEHYGRINVVINNAGVAFQGDLLDSTYDQLERVIDINFWGVVHGTKEFLPHLVASGDGHLVNVSSLAGLMGVPGQSAYNASKFAVRGLTEALRQELLISGAPVGVTCVHPGGVNTNIAARAATTGNANPQFVEFFERIARTTPERAAEQVVRGIHKRKPRVLIGGDAKALDAVVRLMGPRYQRLGALAMSRMMTAGSSR